MELKGKKILIVGTGISGIAAAKLLQKENQLILFDGNEKAVAEDIEKKLDNTDNIQIVIGKIPDNIFSEIQVAVVSPGVPMDSELVISLKEKNIPVIGEIELAYLLGKGTVVGITGTNGKTTTTTLISEFMKNSFDNVYLGGNIGIPLSNFVRDIKPNSYLVLEISDHQLCDMYNFKTNVSVLTNITPTHLDFHKSYEVYQMTKKKIFNNHTSDDLAVINKDDEVSMKITDDIKSTKVYYGHDKTNLAYYDEEGIYYDGKLVIKLDDIILKGKHNYQNIMGAIIAVKKYGVTDEVIQKVLKEFKGVEHRLEYVDTIDGVTYYNDSKATNCVSTITALNSFDKPTILLLGGYDRGHSFHDLDDSMKNVKCVVCFGETKNRIEEFCNDLNIKCYKNDTLKEAMNVVKDICTPGDVVLLSPACASWDQYDRFEDRGNEFKKLVRER